MTRFLTWLLERNVKTTLAAAEKVDSLRARRSRAAKRTKSVPAVDEDGWEKFPVH